MSTGVMCVCVCVITAVVGGADLQQLSVGAVRGVISLPLRPLEAKS